MELFAFRASCDLSLFHRRLARSREGSKPLRPVLFAITTCVFSRLFQWLQLFVAYQIDRSNRGQNRLSSANERFASCLSSCLGVSSRTPRYPSGQAKGEWMWVHRSIKDDCGWSSTCLVSDWVALERSPHCRTVLLEIVRS
jgi:hypothetical protein